MTARYLVGRPALFCAVRCHGRRRSEVADQPLAARTPIRCLLCGRVSLFLCTSGCVELAAGALREGGSSWSSPGG
jgi:hypothetical protein